MDAVSQGRGRQIPHQVGGELVAEDGAEDSDTERRAHGTQERRGAGAHAEIAVLHLLVFYFQGPRGLAPVATDLDGSWAEVCPPYKMAGERGFEPLIG